jgi:hypothetical protein
MGSAMRQNLRYALPRQFLAGLALLVVASGRWTYGGAFLIGGCAGQMGRLLANCWCLKPMTFLKRLLWATLERWPCR